MALTCDLPTLAAAVPGSLMEMAPKIKQALLVLYLYRHKNPATTGQTIPAASLLSSAKCFECAPGDDQLAGYEVWIERQGAIDGGANVGSFSASAVQSEMKCLTCLSMHQLKAIELLLRCSLA